MNSPRTIGLIEDDEILLELLKNQLESGGYRVEVAQNGEQGLAMVREKHPDLLLLDMLMPVLDGFEVLQAMQQEKLLERTPVIVVSNSGQPVEIERLRSLGAKDFLVKTNMTPSEVLAKVDAFFLVPRQPEPDKEAGAAEGETRPIRPNNEGIVLIVEDEEFLVDILRYKFEEKRYPVETAMSVARATEVLSQKPVRIILLDIMLPDINGFEFLTELKKNPEYKDIPVVIISNLGQKHDIERGLSLGAAEYIIKANASPSEIVERTESVLNGKK